MIGGFFTILVNLLVNFAWKISGHMAAMGGLCAVVFFLKINGLTAAPVTRLAITVVLLTGLVGTSRLGLNRHTPLQLLAGTANGFFASICHRSQCFTNDIY